MKDRALDKLLYSFSSILLDFLFNKLSKTKTLLHKIPYPEVGKPSLKHSLEVCDRANIHLSINLNGDLSITGDQLLAALDEEDVRRVIREVLIK